MNPGMRKLADPKWRPLRPAFDEWVGVGHAVLRYVDQLEERIDRADYDPVIVGRPLRAPLRIGELAHDVPLIGRFAVELHRRPGPHTAPERMRAHELVHQGQQRGARMESAARRSDAPSGAVGRGDAMTKEEFCEGQSIVATEWWLDGGLLPDEIRWARLRVFSDGSAEACWEEGEMLYGFESQEYASYFLSADEYDPFDTLDAEDELEDGIVLATIRPPSWVDRPDQPFEYLGQY